MSLRLKSWFGVVIAIFCVSVGDARATPVTHLLCNDLTKVSIDTSEFVGIQKAEIHARRFTVWISYGITREGSRVVPKLNIEQVMGLGCRLDNGPFTLLRPLLPVKTMLLSLSFFGLSKGQHELTIGLGSGDGTLDQSDAYCFTIPGESRFGLP